MSLSVSCWSGLCEKSHPITAGPRGLPVGSATRAGLRWSPGMARSTTTPDGSIDGPRGVLPPPPLLPPPAAAPSPLLLLPIDLWQHVFSTLDGRGLSRAARTSRAWRDLTRPRLDELAWLRTSWLGWWTWWPGPPGQARSRIVTVMMITTCGMGRTSWGSRTGSALVVRQWVSPGGSVFRVGLRWSPGMARSTTTSGGLMVLVRMSRSEG